MNLLPETLYQWRFHPAVRLGISPSCSLWLSVDRIRNKHIHLASPQTQKKHLCTFDTPPFPDTSGSSGFYVTGSEALIGHGTFRDPSKVEFILNKHKEWRGTLVRQLHEIHLYSFRTRLIKVNFTVKVRLLNLKPNFIPLSLFQNTLDFFFYVVDVIKK